MDIELIILAFQAVVELLMFFGVFAIAAAAQYLVNYIKRSAADEVQTDDYDDYAEDTIEYDDSDEIDEWYGRWNA